MKVMKRITRATLTGGTCLLLALVMASCDTTFENPNAASEDQVVSTVDGLQALAIGMRRTHSISFLSPMIRSSALTTREFAVVVGFTNPQEIELGGSALPEENGILTSIWSNAYRVMGMAQQIIDNANVVNEPATRGAYLATGYLFRAMALGNLAQFYESLPITVDEAGEAEFRPRTEAVAEAVRLLTEGLAAVPATVPDVFKSDVLGSSDFDLRQCLNAHLARYQLVLGNTGAAITAANAVVGGGHANVRSAFMYDSGNSNENPLYIQTTLEPATYRPVDNFGFDPAQFVVNPADGRVAFYLEPRDEIGETSRIPVETMKGFFDVVDEPIPVFVPGEMYLTLAEAYARQGELGNAVTNLDRVLTKTDDPFGINAGLPAYSGAVTQADVLLAIYRHRRIETFLGGTSLEDSRRFNRPAPPNLSPPDAYLSFERNRNYYPYPRTERDNNPNTPANPAI
ncbi:MAG: RagB/SusD family nutrient uptake outer membrane protein [Rhodothermales bacterium]|nr:RagB/SusD family nutrient uptake outer membrane protein [Rhodothermales bacterium]